MSILSKGSENLHLLTLPELLSAKKKLALASVDYDPQKVSLKGFDSYSLDPTEFREQLRRNFLLLVTNAELGALVKYLDRDNNGRVNCAAFIYEFLRLGNIERKKILERQKESEIKIEKKKLKRLEEREKVLARLCRYNVPKSFTEEDKKSAISKFAMLALSHDSFNAIALQGFASSSSMTPVQFKEQLKRNFHLYLEPGEVAALVHTFDSNGDGQIDCHEFLQHFFRIGYEEREKFRAKHQRINERIQEAEKKRVAAREEYYAKRVELELKPHTEKDIESVKTKITTVAADYERREQWGDALSAFNSASLGPTDFREVLRQVFYIHVNSAEMSALLEMYGTSDGEIDCGLFLSSFFHAGKAEKERRMMKKLQIDHRLSKQRKKFEDDLVSECLSRKVTAVEWPQIPQLPSLSPSFTSMPSINEDDDILVGSTLSTNMSYERQGSSASTSRRMIRKPSVIDSINPNRAELELMKDNSLTVVYPNTSDDTKNFILEIEKQEKEVQEMNKRTRRKKSRKDTPGKGKSSRRKSRTSENPESRSSRSAGEN
mmetsp:Transcript_10477/g.15974  ORF Transcript_10477/g.15974 Transcript_10477/m.15974 type:complete len:547 (-) Transcript_10477:149-1789(-)|eukprot:CAMPEP_0185030740 /NCGR_PEP_ID=MMETSP1103-20130426/17778_1 /TAXON_ID=36769 /ORGANISM="Paraphysomonas bandaiensis, Strain Caron Lab Isolate" /LENGTH=546 /DNA_ID=CAMNT_0027565975 /DNA_START=51 /DNA_END=1691 /DNA_ORIENTATION=-